MSSVSETVLCEHRGHVAWLTINRPHVLNAMDSYAHLALSQHLDRIAADDAIRVIVLTGAGERAFSVGRDLKELAAADAMSARDTVLLAERWRGVRRLTDRHDLHKPIIARVQGLALGGGFELALACDLIVASTEAAFGLPEPRRGLIPFAGGIHRLPRQMPLKVAMGYLLTGRNMTAAQAHALGLVNAVVPNNELDAEVERWVQDILACAPLAIMAIKQSVMDGLGLALPDAMTARYPLEEKRQASEDSGEGPRAFAAKRAPVWQGR
jgi:enoyl-CoA hydratase/carnithine racemase